ncbi:hypothetical protein QLZ26_16775 [Cronobacter universalis]|uniref:Uncharacterized protein n=1 Tax=Cronobacter universalis NCTC 9529 TaxID=1074000 RepID=A0AAC8ZQY4_9ENTR|nr:hypothetical protein [Cronobacter universalis]ALB54080.1 hypothetical protein AFK65_05150 [Cronobacter universalis NCTC 9529]ELY3465534.1 hypothetical protein [Cronobacter universalis]ELY3759674.1 hypothetical protein [Cronobacter universalis]ELY6244012.1 hypothetical protein [Cronobacter universalis]ELY7393013.1 hypothetical protein [Cronobacter universalis]
MTAAVLNVKIDTDLKDKLRQYAEQNSETLSAATEKLLQKALVLADEDDAVNSEEIDSQHTEEDVSPLSVKEIKALRKLLKKRK